MPLQKHKIYKQDIQKTQTGSGYSAVRNVFVFRQVSTAQCQLPSPTFDNTVCLNCRSFDRIALIVSFTSLYVELQYFYFGAEQIIVSYCYVATGQLAILW